MNLSAPFIHRPVMTTILMSALLIFGMLAYTKLPVRELPNVDFPTISVTASLSGADPATMASSVATPLERQLSNIAGITSMTSTSRTGFTRITLQFALSRDIDSAAQDVQTAISEASRQLPDAMTQLPTLHKSNPSGAAIVYIALTSQRLPVSRMDQYAETRVVERLSMLEGVAEVNVYGSQKYAVRLYMNPFALAARGLSLGDVASTVQRGNTRLPAGTLYGDNRTYVVKAPGQLKQATDFNDLVVAWQDGAAVTIGDVGQAVKGVEGNKRLTQYFNNQLPLQTSIVLAVKRQPGANTVKVAESIRNLLPELSRQAPGDVQLHVMYSRGDYIKASVHEVKLTLLIAVILVVLVIVLFLRSLRATLIAALALPTSLVGSFLVMQWLGFSINNLTLMALVLAVGFVVDDAIVVLENIVRHREMGQPSFKAALLGSREIGFTVISMTLSLVAVFIPIMLMGGLLGRLFFEFAITVAIAILLSGVVSLTLTPMLCSRFLGKEKPNNNAFFRWLEAGLNRIQQAYGKSLHWGLDHWRLMLAVAAAMLVLTLYLFVAVPKGFIPNGDSGQIEAFVIAPSGLPFDEFLQRQKQVAKVLRKNPNVRSAMISTGQGRGGAAGGGFGRLFISLKNNREDDAADIIKQLRQAVKPIVGLNVYFRNPPAIDIGSLGGRGNYQFVLQGLSMEVLKQATQDFLPKLADVPGVVDANTSLDLDKPQLEVNIHRKKAAALGVTPRAIQQTLYYAFGGSKVGTIYTDSDQYQVIMELAPAYQHNLSSLKALYVPSNNGQMVPLESVASIQQTVGPDQVDHFQQLPSTTLSFGVKPGIPLSQITEQIKTLAAAELPAGVSGTFAGNAASFQTAMSTLPWLLVVTLLVIYMVLAILYEHFIHPLTILTALPLAMVGALLSLIIFGQELNIFSFVGLILLVGLVKKNGIIMVDFAIQQERDHQLPPKEAIYQACLVRFRPIMMTTLAAIFGVLPLALATGMGAESRRPMGIAVVGGLVLSQLLTLYITPAFYLAMEKLVQRVKGTKVEPHAN